MRFEYSGLQSALYRMRKSKEKESRATMRREGNFFVRIARKISFQNAPDPMTILNLEQTLGGRLRRAKGVTVPQEIGRRILMIGLLAKNWRFWKVENSLGRIRIYIRDQVHYSKVVDDRQGLVRQAVAISKKSLKKGMDGIIKKSTEAFNRGN